MFFDRIQFLCSQDRVKDISGLLKELDLSTSKGTAWRGGSIPKGDVLAKIADYFCVSIDYLLCRTDDPTPPGAEEKPAPVPESGLSKDKKYLVDAVIDMSDDEARRLRLIVEEVILRRGQ